MTDRRVHAALLALLTGAAVRAEAPAPLSPPAVEPR